MQKPIKRSIRLWLAGGAFLVSSLLPASAAPKVLVYTRNHVTNGKGFVHDNIAASVAAVKELCGEKGVVCEVSEDPAVFTAENLVKYRAVIFSNSNNEAFADPAQSKAFKHLQGGILWVLGMAG